MKKNLFLFFTLAILALNLRSQNQNVIKRCGTDVPPKEWDEYFNKEVEKYKQDLQTGKRAAVVYTIPVIVHVIHGGEPVGTFPNISAAQINSQLNVLNADLSGTGWNVNNLAATAFSAVGAANCEIVFCAATKNKLGQTLPEPGIDRINYVDSGWTNPATFGTSAAFKGYIDATIKPKTIWDPTKYFNVWVTNESLGNVQLLGYATFPAGAALAGLGPVGSGQTDGVFVYAGCYGNVGAVSPPYNLGRTMSHEVGHWLGLRHIGGDGNGNVNGDCDATDYCADTPPQKGGFNSGQYGQNFGAPAYPLYATGTNSCSGAPNGCMFMNFMDYCDDQVSIMFTPDQKTRMVTAMTTALYRQSLSNSAATQCNNPASTPTAYINMPVQICNTVGVISTTAYAVGNPIPSFFWTTTPSAGVTYSPSNLVQAPQITFPTAGSFTVNCAATNSVGTGNSMMTVTVEVCDVGLHENTLNAHIALQPNPSNGLVNLIITLPVSAQIDIQVTNVLGQEIISNQLGDITNKSIELDLSGQSNGVYFISISNGKEKTIKRLVLNK
ncbi:MAG: T9SS type A sorting domain-containing protein [Sphingobacteriaceae bacterium]|nr:T9SS type A sorting domain-containing protein [Sphingobacteriaceae bacterium]